MAQDSDIKAPRKLSEFFSRINPTKVTAVFMGIGDVFMGLSGFLSKGENGEGRNWFKIISSGFGLANIGVWLTEKDETAPSVDDIIRTFDQKLKLSTAEEQATRSLPEKLVGFAGDVVHAPGPALQQVVDSALNDRTALGGNLNVVGSTFMLASGLQKRNYGEISNALGSFFSYGALNHVPDREEAMKLPKSDPMHYVGQIGPSWLSAVSDGYTSISGLAGGIQDMRSGKVPRRAGVLQAIASSIYLLGAFPMFFLSEHQQKLKKQSSITDASSEETKQELFQKAVGCLRENNWLVDSMLKEEREKTLEVAAQKLQGMHEVKHLDHDVLLNGLRRYAEPSMEL